MKDRKSGEPPDLPQTLDNGELVVGQPPPAAHPITGDFRRRLPHFEGRGNPIFVTFCTWMRRKLTPEERSIVLSHVLYDHGVKCEVICAVVMPDHVHLLYWPREDSSGNRYSKCEIVGPIKSISARKINRARGSKGQVWQDEFFDRVVRSEESVENKAQYICDNPVRAGLCSDASDYPWTWKAWTEGGG